MKRSIFAIAAILSTFAASAQSSIECRPDEGGTYRAALIWQNTLGTARADAICQQHSVSMGLTKRSEPARLNQEVMSPVAVERSMNDGARYANRNERKSRFEPAVVERAYTAAGSNQIQAASFDPSQYAALPPTSHQVVSAPPQEDAVLAGYESVNEIAARSGIHPDQEYMLIR